ncbi:hypothetical protein ACVWYF_001412 [Hymenobacter sp. UYAg731]
MKHVSTPLLTYARRGALLLALSAAGPAAWGQSFGPVSIYSTGSGTAPTAVALGDVNNDSRLDIVTANYGTNGVGVLLGRAGGGFAPVVTYPTGTNSVPSAVALGDVNGDSRLDIVTANKSTSSVGVLLGQVGGGFAPVVTYATGTNSSNPIGVALGDVDGDGRPDIVTASFFTNEVGVLLGRAGGFAAVSTYSTGAGSQPYSVALGDTNGDGRLDIVTANNNTNEAGVLLGMASGGFAPVVAYSTGTGSSPADVALADVNGDGRPDIITANSATAKVGVLLGRAGGGFAPVTLYATGSIPQGVAVADVNGDGRLDVVTANAGSSVSVLVGQASGGFATAQNLTTGTGTNPADVALGDVSGDNRPDIVSALFTFTANNIGVLLNTGTYTPLATAHPAAADFTLAPNPAHEAFTVRLPAGLAPTQAELLNALGQVVRRPAVSAGSFTVATSGLAPGIYTLRLRAGGVALAHRVVVE